MTERHFLHIYPRENESFENAVSLEEAMEKADEISSDFKIVVITDGRNEIVMLYYQGLAYYRKEDRE